MNRKDFIGQAGWFLFVPATGVFSLASELLPGKAKKITITKGSATVEKEPLLHPFGFKGGYLTELWQSVVKLQSQQGYSAVGLGTQSILWSDPAVFSAHPENKGNALMFDITRMAARMLSGRTFTNPVTLLDEIFPELYAYGKTITGSETLRKTFVLNALVAVDNAVWLIYAQENNIHSFDEMIPVDYRKALATKHARLAYIPLISYNVSDSELKSSIGTEGSFFIKIKLGQPGTQQEMLEKDIANFTRIHRLVGSTKTSYTDSGKLLYYLDANGRYEHKPLMQEFLSHAKEIGAFSQIAILEEPFPEDAVIKVDDLGVRVSADESAHSDDDVVDRVARGYTAIALKPMAKTLSMSLKMVKKAYEQKVPCFCADLTVNPVMVEWNKNVAARLEPLPGLSTGVLETNGSQNYRHWEKLSAYSASNGQSWTKINQGVFELNEQYYKSSGGIFSPLPHYSSLFDNL